MILNDVRLKRYKFIEIGVSGLKNLMVLPSGKYIISNITFPEYFDKDSEQETVIDSSMDLAIFGKYIAPTLGITVRFMGEEPTDKITKQYNEHMKQFLPRYGIKCIELPRVKKGTRAISASIVREHLANGELDDVKSLVPITTYEYLKRNENLLYFKGK